MHFSTTTLLNWQPHESESEVQHTQMNLRQVRHRHQCADPQKGAISPRVRRSTASSEKCASIASIIQAARCGATICCTHLRLDAKSGFHCDGNYVKPQILGL